MPKSSLSVLLQPVKVLGALLFWIPVAALSLLLIYNTLPYFTFTGDFSFIRERSLLFSNPVYTASFYVHIASGMFCIGAALLQFSRTILKKRTAVHIWSGRIYVFVVLMLGAPTGLYMAFFAKGGGAERALFLFMALGWFLSTLLGLTSIRQGRVLAHKVWMIRSYAFALTAVSFRVYHLFFYLLDWDALQNYQVSLWISVVGNLLAAEWVIWRKARSYAKTFLI